MADDPKKRPLIFNANGRAIRSGGDDPAMYPPPDVMSPQEAIIADLEELRVRVADVTAAVQIHHRAMQEMVALVNSLEDRTLRGRIRRFVAWVELQKLAAKLLVERFARAVER